MSRSAKIIATRFNSYTANREQEKFYYWSPGLAVMKFLPYALISAAVLLSIVPPFYRGTANAHTLSSVNTSSSKSFSFEAVTQAQSEILKSETVIEREIDAGDVHRFKVALAAGDFLSLEVAQRGIDIAVRIYNIDGNRLDEFNVSVGIEGTEYPSVIAENSGDHLIEIVAPDAKAGRGRYGLTVTALRPAIARDRDLVAAEKAFREAEEIRKEGTADARRKAIEKYEQSLALYRAAENGLREAQSHIKIGELHYSLSDLAKAQESFQKAIPVARESGNRQEEANALGNVGVVYLALGRPRDALDYLLNTLSLRQAIKDIRGEATTTTNIGAAYSLIGEAQKALEYYSKAIPLRRAVKDRRGEATTLINVGSAYSAMGEMQKALESYQKALPVIQELGDRSLQASTLNNIGYAYSLLGDQHKALQYHQQALPLRKEVGNRRGEVSTLVNIGVTYNLLGDKKKALEFFDLALPLAREVKDRRGEANILSNMGMSHYLLGEQEKALAYYNQSLPIVRETGNRRAEAQTHTRMGQAYYEMGEMQKAIAAFNEALPLQQATADIYEEANTLYHLARAEMKQGETESARSRIEKSLQIVESLRARVSVQPLRTSFFASVRDHYDLYIDLLMQKHRLAPSIGYDARALEAAEMARARSLLETLIEARAEIRRDVDASLLERERSLQQKLNSKSQHLERLRAGRNKEQQVLAEREVEQLLTEFQTVRTLIRTTSPRYAALTEPGSLSKDEIQKKILDPETLLLEYSLGRERSYLWAVTTNSINSFELPARDQIETPARRLYELATARNRRVRFETPQVKAARIAESDLEYSKAASELSEMLIGPAAHLLGKKRLLIVAEGALQYIPFSALPAPAIRRQTNNARANSPLILEHEIVTLPSASVLAVLRSDSEVRTAFEGSVAVIADPVFQSNDPRVLKTEEKAEPSSVKEGEGDGARESLLRSIEDMAFAEGEFRIPRLPATRGEAEAIIALAPEGKKLKAIDFKASRETVKSGELNRYRIIHFATHGLLNSRNPELSGVILSLVNQEGQPVDGFVRAHEIYNLDLPAELIVLSGCKTGLGKEVRGEGLIGLTRGFMYAGSPRVVVSLWDVNDLATAELMKRFYKKMLAEKQRPASALRAAQVEMWKERTWSQPYYWAAFTLQGEWK